MRSREEKTAIKARRKARKRAEARSARCERCDKISYASEIDAMDMVIGSKFNAGVRVYKCDHGKWHISSRL